MAKQKINAYQNGGWYEELGRATAVGGANPTSLTVSFTAKKYLKIMLVQHSGGSSLNSIMRLNGDSGANYDWRLQENAGADSAANNQTGFQLGINSLDGAEAEFFVVNEAAYAKTVQGLLTFWSNTAGGIYRNLVAFMYRNASSQLTSVSMVATSGSYKDGSELIILGKN